MRRGRLEPVIALVLVAGCGDPELTFIPAPSVLVVGQTASVVVAQGGDGSELDQSSFELEDAAGKTFDATSSDLELKKVSDEEVSFAVPPGIAAGEATLSVKTKKGPAFKGTVSINRLMAMRDLSGKVWLLALLGDGSAAQFTEAGPGAFGVGIGDLAVGYKGRLMAATARDSRSLQLGWLGSKLEASHAHVFDPGIAITEVLVTPAGLTLVGTNKGTYVVEKPTTNPPGALQVSSSVLATGDTYGLAVDSAGQRAVAISDPGTGKPVELARINLAVSPPALEGVLQTTWPGGASAPTTELHVAVSPDGKNILAVDGVANRVALFVEGLPGVDEKDLPAGEEGATAVASSPDGWTFYVVNKKTKNLSLVQVSGGTITFGTPISFDAATSPESGAPVDVAVSNADEVSILLERDIVLLFDKGTKAKTLTFPNLFKDKTGGEVGGAIGIQP